MARLEVFPDYTRFDRAALEAHSLRQGMWVRYDDKVGLLTECKPLTCQVMLTREDGSNLLEVGPLNPWLLRQARYLDIPPLRRPDAEKARLLGYR